MASGGEKKAGAPAFSFAVKGTNESRTLLYFIKAVVKYDWMTRPTPKCPPKCPQGGGQRGAKRTVVDYRFSSVRQASRGRRGGGKAGGYPGTGSGLTNSSVDMRNGLPLGPASAPYARSEGLGMLPCSSLASLLLDTGTFSLYQMITPEVVPEDHARSTTRECRARGPEIQKERNAGTDERDQQ